MVELTPPTRMWHCPACDLRDETRKPGVHTQFHNCPANAGLGIPLIEVPSHDTRADGRQLTVQSEDYVGHANPLVAIRTERGDGSNDCTVFPIPAKMTLRSL